MSQRAADQLRPVTITPNYTDAPLASVLIACGSTRVLCTASEDDSVPPFRQASGGGWMTAEYAMLPGSSPRRVRRASSRAQRDGRATEIQRLIGRSLRAGFDLDSLGPRTLWIDCDVIEADGGTRTAAITGGYVAGRLALMRLIRAGEVSESALRSWVAAISVGIVEGVPYIDLDYKLDSRADVDMNVVMNGEGAFLEVQGCAEKAPFSRSELDGLLDLASTGIDSLIGLQEDAIQRGLEAQPLPR